jgi:hypothetical protein
MQTTISEKLGLDFYAASKIYVPYLDSCDAEWWTSTPVGIVQGKTGRFNLMDMNFLLNKPKCTLLLKDLKNISDDDCVAFIGLVGMIDHEGFVTKMSPKHKIVNAVQWLLTVCDYTKIPLKAAQYLQSKGYALPYLDFTIKQLVEVEIYKIIEN